MSIADTVASGWRLYIADLSIEGRAFVMLKSCDGETDFVSGTSETLEGAIATASDIARGTYRGWSIEAVGFWWQATGPNYDAWTEGEGEWADNGEKVEASTRTALIEEIDAWIAEHDA